MTKRLFWILVLSITASAQSHTFPALDTDNPFTGSNSFSKPVGLIEVAAPTGVAGETFVWASNSTHRPMFNPAAAGALSFVGIATPGTAGNCTQFASNGIDIVDSGGTGCGGGSGAVPDTPLQFCTTDQTGNAVAFTTTFTNYFGASWLFTAGQAGYINCIMRIPHGLTGSHTASLVLEIAANDATAGHTANFQTCDQVATAGVSMNVGALTCPTAQTFTTTTTAYHRVTMTFAVQSSFIADDILIVKVLTATTGTQPSANMLVWPYMRIN